MEKPAAIPPPVFGEKDTLVGGIRWRSREVGGDITPPVVEFGLRHRLYARAGNVTEEMVSDWWDPIPVPGTRRAALGFVRSRTAGYEGLLPKIRVPTLIVWGKEDRLLPASDGMRLASEM